jgi:hypothetical protein
MVAQIGSVPFSSNFLQSIGPASQIGGMPFNPGFLQGMGPASQVGSANMSLDQIIRAAAPYGQGAIDRAVAQFNQQQQQLASQPPEQPAGDSPLVIAGDGWGWGEGVDQSYHEVDRSVTAGGGGGGGSGGGGASGQDPAGGSSSSGLLGNLPSGTGTNGVGGSNSPQFGALPGVSTAPINYQAPAGTTPQYQGPQGNQQGAGPQGGALAMQQASPQSALDQYKNTAGYQLLNAPGAYQASPGYQYAVDEALGQVQRNASARGLLESGRVMRDMTDRAQGMALQDYGNWWNRQNQLYGDYQNRLAGLAGGPTGADMAYNLGQSQGQNSMQTGSNLGSLFGNQGNSGLGAYTNTGAAQANTMQQAGNTQLQVNSANQGTLLAGAMLNRGQF